MTAPAGSPREVQVAVAAQFGLAFSINFMFVFLPFYVQTISPFDEAATLRWTGLIMGGASVVATFVSPMWGYMTGRRSPKFLFERAIFSHGIALALMAFTTDLYLLLGLRLVQGFLGGLSTIGIIIVSATSPREQLSRNMGLYQASMTLGQLAGPPVGALAAAAFGYRAAFLITAALVGAIFAFAHRSLSAIPPQPVERERTAVSLGQVAAFFGVCLAATVQITFLPAILPHLLRGFAVAEGIQPVAAGLIVSAYALASVAGSIGSSRLASRVGATRLMFLCGLAASVLQVLLLASRDVWTFTLLRMAQTAAVSALPTLVMARVAERGHGGTLGAVNASRFAGNALGPILGTFILANGSLPSLYATIAALTLAALLAYRLAVRA
ncbi:MAG TPA: MFS transporter [Candidatus Sulfotelmatobacter sp.]|nr:MFS transporter [Candidatus Sulfotelmatobacter sp.]